MFRLIARLFKIGCFVLGGLLIGSAGNSKTHGGLLWYEEFSMVALGCLLVLFSFWFAVWDANRRDEKEARRRRASH